MHTRITTPRATRTRRRQIRGATSAHRSAVWALLASLATGCAAGLPAIEMASVPTAADYPDDVHAVLLIDALDVVYREVDDEPVAEETVHTQRVALDAEGVDDTVVFTYNQTFTEVVAFEARTVSPDGEETLYTIADTANVMAFPGWVLFSDARALVLTMKHVIPGTVTEVRYTTRTRNLRLFGQQFLFGAYTPTRHAHVSVEFPEGWRAESLVQKLNAVHDWEPTRTVEGGVERWLWEAADLPPLDVEQSAPSRHAEQILVSLRLVEWQTGGERQRGYDSPEELSAAYATMLAGEPGLDAAGHALVEELLAETPDDPEAKARVLHAWVRDHIQYTAVELGIGGWIPAPAPEVLAMAAGDCKGKAHLLVLMLRAAGLEADQVDVYAHSGYPVDFGLPTIAGNANHMIARVLLPDGPVYLDPTARSVAFGELSQRLAGAEVLPIRVGGASLERLPADGAEPTRIVVEATYRLAADGGGSATFRAERSGMAAHWVRSEALDAAGKKRDEHLARAANLQHVAASEVTVEALEPQLDAGPIVVRGTLVAEHLLARAERTASLRADALLSSLTWSLPDRERIQPVLMGFPVVLAQTISITLPAGAVVLATPEPVQFENALGVYSLTWSVRGDGLVLERHFTRHTRVASSLDYGACKQLFDDALSAERRAVMFTLAEADPPAAELARE